jgi:hypothetical protein
LQETGWFAKDGVRVSRPRHAAEPHSNCLACAKKASGGGTWHNYKQDSCQNIELLYFNSLVNEIMGYQQKPVKNSDTLAGQPAFTDR